MRTELEIGDIIMVENVFGRYRMKVYRVTKTMAIARPVGDSDRFETRFKRKVIWGTTAKVVNDDTWSTTDYTILTLDKTKEEL